MKRLALALSILFLFSGCDLLGLGSKLIKVRGKVLDAVTQEPIPDMAVGIYGRNGCSDLDPTRNCSTQLVLTYTDQEGKFSLQHDPTGEFAFIFLFINPDEARNADYSQEVDLLKEGKEISQVYYLFPVNDPGNPE